tara:strand:+ start:1515 stop:2510 length:996 start_codon:yes stop_codon:yes gene_type:complete
MIKTNYKFGVVWLTKDYYPMLEECVYKYSKANFTDVEVVNVDMGSTEKNLEEGKNICKKLGIKMANKSASTQQQGVKVAEEYLTEVGIDVNWMICFQHDVFPMTETFWDDLQDVIDSIDENKVGLIGGNCIMNHDDALKIHTSSSPFESCKTSHIKTGRGMLLQDILTDRYGGWYKNLPLDYYKSKYFVVESPYWTCFVINRKLFKKYVNVDSKIVFELWGDDLAHQFLSHGIVNISVPHLFVCHDHSLKVGINIKAGKLIEERGDFCPSQIRFWEKWGFRWGIRNPDVREQFDKNKDTIYSDKSLQTFFYNLKISDGPLDIDLISKAPLL